MMNNFDYDVLVIGVGFGGYYVVICVLQFGLKMVCVECGVVGGVCFNIGCILIKVLLYVVEIMQVSKYVVEFGLIFSGQVFDIV